MATPLLAAGARLNSSLAVFQDLVASYRPRDFAVRLWDGSLWPPEAGQPARFTLVLNHPGALRRMFWPPRPLSLGQAYLYDDFDVEGDMLAFAGFCRYLAELKQSLSLGGRLKLGWLLWKLPCVDRSRPGRQAARLSGPVHSRQRDRQAISYHYDLSNELFALVLDTHLQYTSGIFAHPEEDLETAQQRKLDLVCRKLRLRPGERLLDIGCGWGGQVLFAGKHHGVQAVGVTLSKLQADWAREQIRAAGLERQCRIELLDYRDLDDSQPFDKIATIEVTEHFGAGQFPTYFRKCWELLRPGGSLLIQQITLSGKAGMAAAREFSQHYVFPDGELVPVSFTQQKALDAGFEVRDVECFREHYPPTLRHWLRRLEARHDEVVRATDEATYRVFRLYFAGACLGFQNNVYNLHQTLLVKPSGTASGYPLSREDWYGRRG
jgi:cyclopropane-fatty-acyl-phospholipid synthase